MSLCKSNLQCFVQSIFKIKYSDVKVDEIVVDISENLKKITAPNYLGNKLRILNDIIPVLVRETDENSCICDLFSGSGSVTAALSDKRSVIAVDIQSYSSDFIKGFSNPASSLDTQRFLEEIEVRFKYLCNLFSSLLNYEKVLLESDSHIFELANFVENASFIRYSQKGFLSKSKRLDTIMLDSLSLLESNEIQLKDIIATWNFGGIYFSFEQTLYIDSILTVIREQELINLKSTVLTLACNLVNTIGKQFAQPLTPWNKDSTPKKSLFKKVTGDRCLDSRKVYLKILRQYLRQPSSKFPVESWCMDFREALKTLPENVTTVYADPPYTRDHYSRFYHVLETLSLGDIPNISTVKTKGKISISKGLYREDRHQSDFCIKSKAIDAFDDLFRLTSEKNIKVVLSYSPFGNEEHPRVMSIEKIIEIGGKYFNEIEQTTISNFKHNKLNSKKNHLTRTKPSELIILLKKPKI